MSRIIEIAHRNRGMKLYTRAGSGHGAFIVIYVIIAVSLPQAIMKSKSSSSVKAQEVICRGRRRPSGDITVDMKLLMA